MDAKDRAKKAASRKKQQTTTPNQSSTNSVVLDNLKQIDLGRFATDFKPNENPTANIAGNVNFDESGQLQIELPGLPQIDVGQIGNLLPSAELRVIEDVRNPGFSADEMVDEVTYERAKSDYQAAIRYQELIQWANKYQGSHFKSLAEKAKAYQKGLMAETDIEKVYQQYLELVKQQAITVQKGTEYIAQAHKTATVQASLPYSIAENEANLEKVRIKALKAFEETKLENDNFNTWFQEKRGENNQPQ